MKTVLCFGDSNTFGYRPDNGMRYDRNTRWTGRLQKLLGDDYWVVEEGCNGRTAAFVDPAEDWKYGLPYLRPCLNSHKPVDIVVLMLGTNDLKTTFRNGLGLIGEGIERMVQVIREFTLDKQGFIPEIILLSPPELGENIGETDFGSRFDARSVGLSGMFHDYYAFVARTYDCILLDAADHVKASPIDCLHLDAAGHEKLADVIYGTIMNECGKRPVFERMGPSVRRAYEIATAAHAGQRDKAGNDYILHPMAVASKVGNDENAIIAGLLHDVVEDTDVTLEKLAEEFSTEVIEALDLLTHERGVPYMEYIKALSSNPLAVKVKGADLKHNMDLSRIPSPTQADYERIEKKYKPAWEYLFGSENDD